MDPIYSQFIPFLEQTLTAPRLRHSLGVMKVMMQLSSIYQLDAEQATLAGLLHDAGKDLSLDRREQIIQQAGLPNETAWELDFVNYSHGPIGAYLIQTELGINEPLVLDAIATHTFLWEGSNLHSPLAWCLLFSDLLEPNRKWDQRTHWFRDGDSHLRDLVFSGEIKKAAFFQTGLIIRFYTEDGVAVSPTLRHMHVEYSAQLGLDDSYFEPYRLPD